MDRGLQRASGSDIKEGRRRISKWVLSVAPIDHMCSQISLCNLSGYILEWSTNLTQEMCVCLLCKCGSTLHPLEFILSMVLFSVGLVGSISST